MAISLTMNMVTKGFSFPHLENLSSAISNLSNTDILIEDNEDMLEVATTTLKPPNIQAATVSKLLENNSG